MEQGIVHEIGTNRAAVPGRKSSARDKQESVVRADQLTPAVIDSLVADFLYAADAANTLSEGIKAAAEKAGIQATVLRKFITARAGEKFEEKKRDCAQLNLLFEEVGQ
jgi:hypothetical protein